MIPERRSRHRTPEEERADPRIETQLRMRAAARYWNLWPEYRDRILGEFQAEGESIAAEAGLPNVQAIRSQAFTDRVIAGENIAAALRWRAMPWIMAIHSFGGPLALTLVHGGHIAIVGNAEVADLLTASDAELREIPPVYLRIDVEREKKRYTLAVPGDPNAYILKAPRTEYETFSPAWAELYAILEPLNPDARIEDPSPFQATEIRALFRTFAREFWAWYEHRDEAEEPSLTQELQPRYHSALDLGKNESFLVPSAQVFHGAHRAIVSPEGWQAAPDDFPFYDDAASRIRYSIGGITSDGSFDPKTDAGFQADLASLDPQQSLVYAAVMGAWTQAYFAGKLTPSGSVVIHVNDILELRGIKKKKRVFRVEQKQEASRQLRRLTKLYVRGEGVLPNGKRKRITGQLCEIAEAEVEDLFGYTPYAFAIRPGQAVQPFFEQSPQLAQFFTPLAKLDTRQGVERIAYLIGLYLAFHFRIREAAGNYEQPFLVRTLIEGARIHIESNAKLFSRFQNQVEAGLDRLQADGVIAAWQYVPGDYEALPVHRWFRPWLDKCRVVITPPPIIAANAVVRRNGRERSLPAPRVRKARP